MTYMAMPRLRKSYGNTSGMNKLGRAVIEMLNERYGQHADSDRRAVRSLVEPARGQRHQMTEESGGRLLTDAKKMKRPATTPLPAAADAVEAYDALRPLIQGGKQELVSEAHAAS